MAGARLQVALFRQRTIPRSPSLKQRQQRPSGSRYSLRITLCTGRSRSLRPSTIHLLRLDQVSPPAPDSPSIPAPASQRQQRNCRVKDLRRRLSIRPKPTIATLPFQNNRQPLPMPRQNQHSGIQGRFRFPPRQVPIRPANRHLEFHRCLPKENNIYGYRQGSI